MEEEREREGKMGGWMDGRLLRKERKERERWVIVWRAVVVNGGPFFSYAANIVMCNVQHSTTTTSHRAR